MSTLVSATQLGQWFDSKSRRAQEMLPDLVRRLILATVPGSSLLSIHIPVGDDIARPGFDGVVETTAEHLFVPKGRSVWEMGTADPQGKAECDYKKRSGELESTFTFVSPKLDFIHQDP